MNETKSKGKAPAIRRDTEVLALWAHGLLSTVNAVFLPMLWCTSRFLVLKGGGGSGKSIFAGRKILERCVTESGHRFLVVRKTLKSIKDSCFKQLCEQAEAFYSGHVVRITESPMHIVFDNGSEIIFSGLDNVEKLKSIYNVSGIWVEEASEITEYDFNQLNIRLRGRRRYYKQIILTFNPVSITSWLKKRFFDRSDPDATVSETTYKDNRFLPDEDIRVLLSFRDTDEYYFMVYCLGQWGVTGRTVFDAKRVSEQLSRLVPPLRRGFFLYRDDGLSISDMAFADDERGATVRIYREVEEGVPYVIGADTAGDGSDAFVAQVLNNVTKELCATLKMTTGEAEFARQLYCLGMHYNKALIAVESNFSTYPILELQRLSYPRQYVRTSFDEYTHKPRESFGFKTDKLTRNVAIAALIKHVKEKAHLIWDYDTLSEMLTFVRNEDFRPEAQEGAHDDCVMALAIALQAASQQRGYIELPSPDRGKWTEDMKEDWRHADKATRAELERRWGKMH